MKDLTRSYFLSSLKRCRGFLSAHEIVDSLLSISDPVWLCMQTELAEGKDVAEPEAGSELNSDLQKLIDQHQREITEVRAEISAAVMERDEQARRDLQTEHGKLEAEREQWAVDQRQLQRDLGDAKKMVKTKKINAGQVLGAVALALFI
jgi:hypothetical protein